MARPVTIVFLLALSACGNAPSGPPQGAPPAATAKEQTCVPERANVRLEGAQIFWNGQPVDEPELARRSAAHWCGERTYAIMIEQSLPDPRDSAAMARSMRVSRLVGTKQATLADTLKQLADGTY